MPPAAQYWSDENRAILQAMPMRCPVAVAPLMNTAPAMEATSRQLVVQGAATSRFVMQVAATSLGVEASWQSLQSLWANLLEQPAEKQRGNKLLGSMLS